MIHSTAIIDPTARLGERVSIGPCSVIGADVEIGDDCHIGPHVVIAGPTRLGRENHVFSFASIGGDPQDLTYAGEPTRLEIGDRNTIRESVTISRGTAKGGGVTRIGDDNLIMAYVHIAHDCRIGNHVIFSNASSLAGHVEVGDHVSLGGFTLVHQFARIGTYAFSSMGAALNRDLPPFCVAQGNYARLIGINKIGLRRKGFDDATIEQLHRVFMDILRSPVRRAERIRAWCSRDDLFDSSTMLLRFIEASHRGVLHAARNGA